MNRRDFHNLRYLQNLERKKAMPIFDAMGFPAGGPGPNNQPQPQGMPLPLHLFIQWYDVALRVNLQHTPLEPLTAVARAKVFADAALANIGFRALRPLGLEILQPEPEAESP